MSDRATTLPEGAKERKTYPIASGVLDYFPDAIAAIAHVSYVGNEQHNPGQPLHWAREKSTDQDDTLIRHFLERGKLDTDGLRHTAKLAWRALALLQLEIEAEQNTKQLYEPGSVITYKYNPGKHKSGTPGPLGVRESGPASDRRYRRLLFAGPRALGDPQGVHVRQGWRRSQLRRVGTMRIGCDIDGVLANFNASFMRRIVEITGRDLFPPDYEPTTWNYPESVGYTAEEVDQTWINIKADRVFWYCLRAYPDTENAMAYLADRISHHHDDVYFITARPGVDAKKQTEQWLVKEFGKITSWHVLPTVLITPHKGLAVQTLNLDVYIDDRDRNCLEAAGAHWSGSVPKCRTFIMDRPWNPELSDPRIERVSSVVGICD